MPTFGNHSTNHKFKLAIVAGYIGVRRAFLARTPEKGCDLTARNPGQHCSEDNRRQSNCATVAVGSRISFNPIAAAGGGKSVATIIPIVTKSEKVNNINQESHSKENGTDRTRRRSSSCCCRHGATSATVKTVNPIFHFLPRAEYNRPSFSPPPLSFFL